MIIFQWVFISGNGNINTRKYLIRVTDTTKLKLTFVKKNATELKIIILIYVQSLLSIN